MKKIVLLVVLLTIYSISLNAKNIYIKLGVVTHKDALFNVKYKLDLLNYPFKFKRYKNGYLIYTGPFKTVSSAKQALYRTRKYITSKAYIPNLDTYEQKQKQYSNNYVNQSPLTASNTNSTNQITKKINTDTNVTKNNSSSSTNEKITNNKNNSYIGFTFGTSRTPFRETKINGDLTLNFELKNTGFNYGIETGYYFTDSFLLGVNYQYSNFTNLGFHNGFISLNYKFDEILYNSPYIGLLGGYSLMKWIDNPINSSNNTSMSSSFLKGLQLGTEIGILGDLSMHLSYRYLMFDYVTNLKTATEQKKLEYTSEHNFLLGLRYNF